MTIRQLAAPAPLPMHPRQTQDAKMRRAAQKFEAVFLTEMLGHTGLGRSVKTFSGGAGESAFSSFLVREYAKKISEHESIGLADQVYRALKAESQRD